MSGGIYLIDSDGELVEMSESSYGSEDLLQELLAKYWNLLVCAAADRVLSPDLSNLSAARIVQ